MMVHYHKKQQQNEVCTDKDAAKDVEDAAAKDVKDAASSNEVCCYMSYDCHVSILHMCCCVV